MTADPRPSRRWTAVNQFMAPTLQLETVAAMARELGLDGVGVFRPCLEDLGVPAVQEILDGQGLRATSICVVLGLTGATAEQRRTKIEDARRAVRHASELRAPLVIVAGGPDHRPAGLVIDEFEDQLAVIAAEARRADVRLLLEPLHPSQVYLSVLTSLRDACRIASQYSNVGVVLDTWHVWTEPDLIETASKYAELIDIVHLSDWRPGPFTGNRALPGQGVMDIHDLVSALRSVLHDVWWELEVLDDRATGSETQRMLLRDSVRSARTCGVL